MTGSHQCVFPKCMLQSPRLKDQMMTIGIYQLLNKGASFEHKCLNNNKKIYQHACNCYDQEKFKDIIEAEMVSTLEEITDDSPCLPMTQTKVKKPNARKSLYFFTNVFDVKNRTSILCFGAAKSKRRAIRDVSRLWANKTKSNGYSKINDQIKHKLYTCIMRHPQVVQSPIFIDCFKMIFDDQTEAQMVPKLLLRC